MLTMCPKCICIEVTGADYFNRLDYRDGLFEGLGKIMPVPFHMAFFMEERCNFFDYGKDTWSNFGYYGSDDVSIIATLFLGIPNTIFFGNPANLYRGDFGDSLDKAQEAFLAKGGFSNRSLIRCAGDYLFYALFSEDFEVSENEMQKLGASSIEISSVFARLVGDVAPGYFYDDDYGCSSRIFLDIDAVLSSSVLFPYTNRVKTHKHIYMESGLAYSLFGIHWRLIEQDIPLDEAIKMHREVIPCSKCMPDEFSRTFDLNRVVADNTFLELF